MYLNTKSQQRIPRIFLNDGAYQGLCHIEHCVVSVAGEYFKKSDTVQGCSISVSLAVLSNTF